MIVGKGAVGLNFTFSIILSAAVTFINFALGAAYFAHYDGRLTPLSLLAIAAIIIGAFLQRRILKDEGLPAWVIVLTISTQAVTAVITVWFSKTYYDTAQFSQIILAFIVDAGVTFLWNHLGLTRRPIIY